MIKPLEQFGKLVEFAERLELKYGDEVSSTYQFLPNENVRPCGLLFWGPPEALLFSVKICEEEQILDTTDPFSTRFFLNPYISIEAVLYWVKTKAKLRYTNLALPIMKPGDKMQVIVDKPCTICVCGFKKEL